MFKSTIQTELNLRQFESHLNKFNIESKNERYDLSHIDQIFNQNNIIIKEETQGNSTDYAKSYTKLKVETVILTYYNN